MDIQRRIEQLQTEREWNYSQIAKAAKMPPATVKKIARGDSKPTLSSIVSLASGFGIPLSEFFNENTDIVYLSERQKELLSTYNSLNQEKQQAFLQIMCLLG